MYAKGSWQSESVGEGRTDGRTDGDKQNLGVPLAVGERSRSRDFFFFGGVSWEFWIGVASA